MLVLCGIRPALVLLQLLLLLLPTAYYYCYSFHRCSVYIISRISETTTTTTTDYVDTLEES